MLLKAAPYIPSIGYPITGDHDVLRIDLIEKAREKAIRFDGTTLPFVGNIDPSAFILSRLGLFQYSEPPYVVYPSAVSELKPVTLEYLEQAKVNTEKATEYALGFRSLPFLNAVVSDSYPTASLVNLIHLRRDWCETDERFVQLLPYIIFYKRTGGSFQIFTYQRGKGVGEERLAGNYSIGIGGHINPYDQFHEIHHENHDPILVKKPLTTTVCANIIREVREEVTFSHNGIELGLLEVLARVGHELETLVVERSAFFLDYGASQVEKVHLGLFIAIEIPEDVQIKTKEDSLVDVGFMDLDELYTFRNGLYPDTIDGTKPLENWSKAIVESLYRTQQFQEGDTVDWCIGTLARIFDKQYDLYNSNVFLKV